MAGRGKFLTENPEANLVEYKQTGLSAIEFSLPDLAFAKRIMPLLKQHEIQMPSVYVNSTVPASASEMDKQGKRACGKLP